MGFALSSKSISDLQCPKLLQLFPCLKGDFCHLLVTLANSLDPDQDQQNVGPDLDLNLTLKGFLKKLIKKNVSRRQRKHEK